MSIDWLSLNDKAAEAAASARQKMSENIDALKVSVGEGIDALGETADSAKQKMSENIDALKVSVSEGIDALSETASSVQQSMSEGVDALKETVGEKVAVAKDSLSDCLADASKKVKGLGMDLSELTTKVMDNIEEYARYFTESDLWKKLQENASKAGSQVVYMALCLFYFLKSEENVDKSTDEHSGEKAAQDIT